MFGFLKDKLKSVVDKFSKKVESEGKEEIIEITKKEKPKTETKPTKPKEEKKSSKAEQKEKKKKVKQEKPEHKKSESKKEKIIEEQEENKESEQSPAEITEKQAPQESEEQVKQEIEILEKEEIEEKQEKKGFFSRLFGKKTTKEEEFEEVESAESKEEQTESEESKEAISEIKGSEKPLEETIAEKLEEETEHEVEDIKEELEDKQKKIEPIEEEISEEEQEEPESKGFFSFIKEKITTKKIDEKQFEEIFWDLEMALLESNVAVEVIEKIKEDLKEKLVNQPIKKSEINNIIKDSLKESIENLFDVPTFNLLQRIKEKKPCVICFIGVNGGGKTTTIAKIAHLLQKNKLTCVMAAADTFRAAAIQQLEEHANNLNIKIIKHDYGADSAAVAFDAVKHAEARHIDAVLIDTAGRLHSNEDLMKEMQKLVRVAKPDLKIFIGESITGNDCVEQAKKFNELIGIDAIILSKADIDDKGGAAISVSYITKKPILYLGTGQTYDDLKEFNKEDIIKSLGL